MSAFKGTQADLIALFGGSTAAGPPASSAEPTLAQGVSGSAVKTAQTRLNVRGAKLTVTGVSGR